MRARSAARHYFLAWFSTGGFLLLVVRNNSYTSARGHHLNSSLDSRAGRKRYEKIKGSEVLLGPEFGIRELMMMRLSAVYLSALEPVSPSSEQLHKFLKNPINNVYTSLPGHQFPKHENSNSGRCEKLGNTMFHIKTAKAPKGEQLQMFPA